MTYPISSNHEYRLFKGIPSSSFISNNLSILKQKLILEILVYEKRFRARGGTIWNRQKIKLASITNKILCLNIKLKISQFTGTRLILPKMWTKKQVIGREKNEQAFIKCYATFWFQSTKVDYWIILITDIFKIYFFKLFCCEAVLCIGERMIGG